MALPIVHHHPGPPGRTRLDPAQIGDLQNRQPVPRSAWLRKINAATAGTCQLDGMVERFELPQGGGTHARLGLYLCVVIVLTTCLLALMYICLYGGWPWP